MKMLPKPRPDAWLGSREEHSAGAPGDTREARKRRMYRGWRPPGLRNSNSEHLEAPKRRQGRWIVTWGASRGSMWVQGHRQGRWIMTLEAPRAPGSLPEELLEPPDTSRSHQTPYMESMSSTQRTQSALNKPPKTLSSRCARRNARSG